MSSDKTQEKIEKVKIFYLYKSPQGNIDTVIWRDKSIFIWGKQRHQFDRQYIWLLKSNIRLCGRRIWPSSEWRQRQKKICQATIKNIRAITHHKSWHHQKIKRVIKTAIETTLRTWKEPRQNSETFACNALSMKDS